MNPEKCVEAIRAIDDLNYKLRCGLNMVDAIREAVEYGKLDAKEWKDGLFAAHEYLASVQADIQEAVDGCCAV